MPITRRSFASGLIAAGAAAGAPLRAAHAQMTIAAAPPLVTDRPRWQRLAVPGAPMDGRPTITIVIDDLGVIHPWTSRAAALPGPLTLAWFPFARSLPEQIGEARLRGHEAILHMPMQAFSNSTAWTGPDPLRIDLPLPENLRRLQAALDAVPDTVGLNNHMGSVATRSEPLMDLVAAEAKRRDMLVLDSVTIGHSLAYRQAALAGVPAASRDIFIDNSNDSASIRGQLALIEATARRQGHVIAIGHARPLTVEALDTWLPTLHARGFVLQPLSATVAFRNEIPFPV